MKLKKQNYATNSRNDKITQITLELKKVIKKLRETFQINIKQ